MTTEEVRIECLKLAHRADREAAEIVARAKTFEAYVTNKAGDSPLKKGGSSKKSETQDPFKD